VVSPVPLIMEGQAAIDIPSRAMHDHDGPQMAQWVYEALLENDVLELDDIPYALDEAVQKLRHTGASPYRWATFVHLGA
jgi:hypothetical protein